MLPPQFAHGPLLPEAHATSCDQDQRLGEKRFEKSHSLLITTEKMEARHVAFQRISAFAGITRRLCRGSNSIRGLCILQTLRFACFINKTLFIGNVRAHGFPNKFGELKYFVPCTGMRELIKVQRRVPSVGK
ncbi:hypothetical protein CDAR_52301 [Caerostris darwini]|uniref:Uncharacterized protein n=1 Tax=Caerostris darwini TaxID=1538125 RepID=A0AAV4V2I4_9ARAC|nr:hypothetical protein CDAR_52301 [Caerostris darwini]